MIQRKMQVRESSRVRRDTSGRHRSALRTLLAGVEQCRSALFGTDSSAMLLVDSLASQPGGRQRLASVVEIGTAAPGLSAWMFNQRPSVVRVQHRERTELDASDIDALIAGCGDAPLLLLVAPKRTDRAVGGLLQRLFTLQVSDPGEARGPDSRLLALKSAFAARLAAIQGADAPRVVAAHWDSGSHTLEIIEG